MNGEGSFQELLVDGVEAANGEVSPWEDEFSVDLGEDETEDF